MSEAFLSDAIATVVGGAILAGVFLLLSDYVFRLAALSGAWTCVTSIRDTRYEPFGGMELVFTALIWQEGRSIRGTGELVRERSRSGVQEYVGSSRTRVVIRGYLEHRYLAADRAVLHLTHFGKRRTSSSVHLLKVVGKWRMSGTFVSTVADSEGSVVWRKTR